MRKLEHLLSPFIFLTLWQIAVWYTHRYMVKSDHDVKKLKLASYKEVEHKMLSIKWEFNAKYPEGLFTPDDSSYFHAGIIRFGDVGYLLTPFGLLYSKHIQRKIRKTLVGYETFKKPYVK